MNEAPLGGVSGPVPRQGAQGSLYMGSLFLIVKWIQCAQLEEVVRRKTPATWVADRGEVLVDMLGACF